MIIDFHTHIFPDKIARTALNVMRKRMMEQIHSDMSFDEVYPLATDATLNGHRTMMKKEKIDMSIILPVATNQSQTGSINRFAEEIKSDDILSFGAVYPYQKDWEYVMCNLAERGFKGIKLHPVCQHFYIDGKEGIRILKKAEQLGLIVVLHAGYDPEYVDRDHGSAVRLKHVLEEVEGSNIVAAHLGGLNCFDDVEKYLVGSPLMFDTSYVSRIMDKEQYARIIKNHGADKVLFGSDSPWQDPFEALEALKNVGLNKEDFDKITYKNAIFLLENK